MSAGCVYLTAGAAFAISTLSSRLQFTGLKLTAGVLLTLLQHARTHTHTHTQFMMKNKTSRH